MNTGLLIYNDDAKQDLQAKVQFAIKKHRAKCDTMPNVCYVHTSALLNVGPFTVDGVRVASLPTVLRHHFWIGRDEK